MPTYDYRCAACGHELEIFQSMSESPKRKCPECGKLRLERQIGMGAGVIFKGSGFYETDYRSDSYKQGARADSKAAEGGRADSKAASEGKATKDSGEKPQPTGEKPPSTGEKKPAQKKPKKAD